MKKSTAAFLLLSIFFSLASCNKPADETDGTEACVHEWQAVECTLPKTCTLCGETEGDPLGHGTSGGVCTRCSADIGIWLKARHGLEQQNREYIKTNEYLSGSFSNSATAASPLKASLIFEEEGMDIRLYEYGNVLVKNYFDKWISYAVSLQDKDGVEHPLSGHMRPFGDAVILEEEDKKAIITALLAGDVTIRLKYDGYAASTYVIAVPQSNFTDLYQML